MERTRFFFVSFCACAMRTLNVIYTAAIKGRFFVVIKHTFIWNFSECHYKDILARSKLNVPYVFEGFRAKLLTCLCSQFDEMWTRLDIGDSLTLLHLLRRKQTAKMNSGDGGGPSRTEQPWRPYNCTVAEQTRHRRIKMLKIKLDHLNRSLAPRHEQIRVSLWRECIWVKFLVIFF